MSNPNPTGGPRSKADAEAFLRKIAWDEGVTCPTCQGNGKTKGGRLTVHTFRGGMGADNGLDQILAELAASERCEVQRGLLGWVLVLDNVTVELR
jgi:hypothetical protein